MVFNEVKIFYRKTKIIAQLKYKCILISFEFLHKNIEHILNAFHIKKPSVHLLKLLKRIFSYSVYAIFFLSSNRHCF